MLHQSQPRNSNLTDLQKHAKKWDDRHVEASLKRLAAERQRLQENEKLTRNQLENIEVQIAMLEQSQGQGLPNDSQDARTNESHGANAYIQQCMTSMLWVYSGILNGMLKLIFCTVYALIIVDAAPHLFKDEMPILVGTQLASAFVTNLFTSQFSSVGASISGPDIVHALVMKTMAVTVAQITDDKEVALATVLFLMCFTSFCISFTWLLVAKFRLMIMIDFFPVSVVNGFLGCVGYKVLKEAIHIAVGPYWYDPFSVGFWRLLLPALPIGVPLYLLKRFHIGDPKVSMFFYILIPPVIFFIAQAGSDKTLDQTRDDGWLIEEVPPGLFYAQWSNLQWSKISSEAIFATLPETMVLIVMVTLDAFLYLKMTKRALDTKMDMETELYTLGFQNLLASLFVGAAGYSQVKFNKINYSITNNAEDRRPTVLIALICAFFWLSGVQIVNVLPRFFLSGLLIYAGLFFAELVILSYQRVNKKEYCIVWLIIFINAIAGLKSVTGPTIAPHSLLIAVIVGLVLAAMGFIYQYARVSVVRDVLSGQDFQSAVLRPYAEQRLVERLGRRYMIIELEGYIFFGSATQVVTLARLLANENVKTVDEGGRPTSENLTFVSIDFAHVENIDYSGAGAFRDVRDVLLEAGCNLIFTSLNTKVRTKLVKEGIISKNLETEGSLCREFVDLDFASEYVESCLLERAAYVRGYWLLLDSFRKLHNQAVLKANFEIFEAILGSEAGNRLWRYAEQQTFKAGEFLCREGYFNHTLYLLQRGKVTTFVATGGGIQNLMAISDAHRARRGSISIGSMNLGSESAATSIGVGGKQSRTGPSLVKTKRDITRERSLAHNHVRIKRKHTMGRGAFVNEECLFRDAPVQHSTIADVDCVVWAISRQSMKELEAHDPNLAAAILRNILRVSSAVRERLEREVFAIESFHNTNDMDVSVSSEAIATQSSKKLGNSVLKQIRDMHDNKANSVSDINLIDDTLHVTGAGSHHIHHFHHMAIDNVIAGQKAAGFGTNEPTSPVSAALKAGFSSRTKRASSLDWHSVRPHLSAAQRQDAIDCFLVHSVLQVKQLPSIDDAAHPDILPELILAGVAPQVVHAVASKVNKKEEKMPDPNSISTELKTSVRQEDVLGTRKKARKSTLSVLHEIRRPKSFRELEANAEKEAWDIEANEVSLLESIMRSHTIGRGDETSYRNGDAKAIAEKFANATSSLSSPRNGPPESPVARHELKLGNSHRRLSLEELQRAVMDLGFFPSAGEVRQMHETLGPHHQQRVDSSEFGDGVDLDEFLEMITVLSLKRMTQKQLHGLHDLFVQHADADSGTQLSKEALGKLMKSLNHPEDEVELEFLMREWDLVGRGYLDFDAFVSIVSHVLKSEELDEQLEQDFLRVCGESDVNASSTQHKRCVIVAADIVKLAKEIGIHIDDEIAEEMVFDADEDQSKKISLDELIATLETVHIDETIDDINNNADTGAAGDDWIPST